MSSNCVDVQWLVGWFVTSLGCHCVYFQNISVHAVFYMCVCVRARACVRASACFFILPPLKFGVTYYSTDFLLHSFWCRILMTLVGWLWVFWRESVKMCFESTVSWEACERTYDDHWPWNMTHYEKFHGQGFSPLNNKPQNSDAHWKCFRGM
jgi:hypothetical protein